MLVTMKQLLNDAYERKFGIVAPNVFDEATVSMCIEAAEENSSPIIIDFAEGHGDIESFANSALYHIRKSSIPVALNLDHGHTYENIIKAIRNGFSSVMIDCSTLPFEENISKVKEIVKIAHSVDVSVEAELGHVGMGNQTVKEINLTVPEEASQFVKETCVDCLAVAIGTAHGKYCVMPSLDFTRLTKINELVKMPLVLHGGSGTGEEPLKKAISLGVSKINIGTDLFNGFCEQYKPYLEKFDAYTLLDARRAGLNGYKDKLIYYIKLFGSADKAMSRMMDNKTQSNKTNIKENHKIW